MGHDPFVVITFPVGSSLEDSLITQPRCRDGDFLMAAFRAPQST